MMTRAERFSMSMDGLLMSHGGQVPHEWIDEYGHMNMSRYLEACDHGTYSFWQHVNGGKSLEERDGAEYAVVETHINYMNELHESAAFAVFTQLLDFDAKRFHIFHHLERQADGEIVATNEVMSLGFSLKTRGIEPFNAEVLQNLEAMKQAHDALERPRNAGRSIVIKRK